MISGAVTQTEHGAYQASIFIDGQQTTRCCPHNHQTERTAQKCVSELVTRHRRYFSNATCKVVDDEGLHIVWTIEKDRPVEFRYRLVQA